MNRKQALKIIREAIAPKLQEFAFLANMYDKGHKTPLTEKDFLKRQKILTAMRVLEAAEMEQLAFELPENEIRHFNGMRLEVLQYSTNCVNVEVQWPDGAISWLRTIDLDDKYLYVE